MKKFQWQVPTEENLKSQLLESNLEKVTIKVTAQLTEPMLGTVPKNKQIYSDYIAEKMGNFQGKPLKTMEELEEEIETVPESEERSYTGFHTDDDGIFLYNYMLLGNIKANLFILGCAGFSKVLAYKKTGDLFVTVKPRRIRLYREDNLKEPDGILERSIRGETAKGPRTFLGKSDFVEIGTKFKFEVELLKNDRGLTPAVLVETLKLGKKHGIGQWRGSGNFGTYKILSLKYV